MGRTGKILQIDELIAAHWEGCDVLQGETPEAYAIRHEEAVLFRGLDFGYDVIATYVRFADGRIEILAVHAESVWRVKESR